MEIKKLKDVAFSVEHADFQKKSDGELRVTALLMYEGEFEDAHGQHVKITRNLMNSIANQYRLHLQKQKKGHGLFKKILKKDPEPLYKPISLNHEKNDVEKIVGHVIDLYVEEHEGQSFLMGTLRISDENAIKKVEARLWREVSISFDYDDSGEAGAINEISYVFEGAVPDNDTLFSSIPTSPVPRMMSRSIDLAKKKIDLEHLRKNGKRIELELKRVEAKKSAYSYIDQMVKDGLISRADFKKLAIDINQVNLSKFDPLLRALKTIATTKKAARGQVSNNFQMSAFDSFMDGFNERISQGGDTMQKFNADDVAKAIIEKVNTGKDIDLGSPMSGYMHESEKVRHGTMHEQHHEEAEHLTKFSMDDMKRMHGMCQMGDMDGMMHFMKEMSGMNFEYDDKEEDNDSAEHKGDEEGYPKESETVDHKKKKMGAMDDDSEMGKKKHDYAKLVDEKFVNLSKELKDNREATEKLTDAIIALAAGTSKEAK